jgi:hypothetical protein
MIHTRHGDFNLKYTYNAMAEHEERFKIPLLADAKRTTLPAIRRLIWSGLIYLKKHFTLDQAGDMIEDAIMNGDDLVDLQAEIEKAIDEAVFMQRLAEKSAKRLAEEKQ